MRLGALDLEIGGRLSRYDHQENLPGTSGAIRDSMPSPPAAAGSRTVTSAYQDTHLRLTWSHGPLLVSALAGYRTGQGFPGRRAFGTLEAAWQMVDGIALLAETGNVPAVPELGIEAGHIIRLGAVVDLIRRRSPSTTDRAEPSAGAPPRERAFLLEPAADGRYAVRCLLPGAQSVEASGDYSDWRPSAMTRESGDWWRLETVLTPGQHRISLRVDGGGWEAPSGLTPEQDGFGGTVGAFLVR